MNEEIIVACMRRYLAACKYKHSLAFFKWRERQKSNSQTDFYNIITERLNNLKIKSKIKNSLFDREDKE